MACGHKAPRYRALTECMVLVHELKGVTSQQIVQQRKPTPRITRTGVMDTARRPEVTQTINCAKNGGAIIFLRLAVLGLAW